jgi:hypothetical protein
MKKGRPVIRIFLGGGAVVMRHGCLRRHVPFVCVCVRACVLDHVPGLRV